MSETLMPALEELERAYLRFKKDEKAQAELQFLLREYAGRPTLLPLHVLVQVHLGQGGECRCGQRGRVQARVHGTRRTGTT